MHGRALGCALVLVGLAEPGARGDARSCLASTGASCDRQPHMAGILGRAVLAAACVCALSCKGDDGGAAPGVPIGDGDGDGDGQGPSDAGSALDAAPPALPDGGTAQSDAEVMASGCMESAPRFQAPFAPGGRGFDVAVEGLEVYVAFTAALCPGTGNEVLGHELRVAHFQTSGEAAQAQAIPVVAAEQCALVNDPVVTLAAGATVSASVHFLSNREGAAAWGVFRTDPADATHAITRLAPAGLGTTARHLVGTAQASGATLAWVEVSSSAADSIRIFEGASARTLLGAQQGLVVDALTMGLVGESSPRTVVGLASPTDNGDYFVLPVPTDPSMPGLLYGLTADVGGTPMISLAGTGEGGALVYTEGPGAGEELRFKGLDVNGEPRGTERKLTTGNQRIAGPAVTPFATGYVVAYRAVHSAEPDRATLRLAFLDSDGNQAGTRDVLETSASGGQVKVLATVDGRLVIGFADVDGEGAFTLHVARVTCSG